MSKSTAIYWNPLNPGNCNLWKPIKGLETMFEEVFIVSGRLYDQAFKKWLEPGDYASRPPGEVHGPFKTETGCIVLEVSFPNRIGG